MFTGGKKTHTKNNNQSNQKVETQEKASFYSASYLKPETQARNTYCIFEQTLDFQGPCRLYRRPRHTATPRYALRVLKPQRAQSHSPWGMHRRDRVLKQQQQQQKTLS